MQQRRPAILKKNSHKWLLHGMEIKLNFTAENSPSLPLKRRLLLSCSFLVTKNKLLWESFPSF